MNENIPDLEEEVQLQICMIKELEDKIFFYRNEQKVDKVNDLEEKINKGISTLRIINDEDY